MWCWCSCAQAVGHPEPLKSTHRLDQCTEGLLVLGKTKAFVARFHTLLKGGGSGGSGSASSDSKGSAGADGDVAAAAAAEGEADGAPRPVRKFYRAATAAAPPRGLLRHRLSVERRRLGLPTFTVAHEWGQAVEGSQEAQLRVVEVRQIR